MAKKKKILSIKEIDRLLDELDIQPILNSRVRQVKWLFNNSNKCTMVYDEKLVRVIVHRYEQKLKEFSGNCECDGKAIETAKGTICYECEKPK